MPLKPAVRHLLERVVLNYSKRLGITRIFRDPRIMGLSKRVAYYFVLQPSPTNNNFQALL